MTTLDMNLNVTLANAHAELDICTKTVLFQWKLPASVKQRRKPGVKNTGKEEKERRR